MALINFFLKTGGKEGVVYVSLKWLLKLYAQKALSNWIPEYYIIKINGIMIKLSYKILELYMAHLFRIIGQSLEHLITSFKMAAEVNMFCLSALSNQQQNMLLHYADNKMGVI